MAQERIKVAIYIGQNHMVGLWTDDKLRPIIIPSLITPEGKIRGGSFVAAPVFGLVPNTVEWTGVSLLQHGLLRKLEEQDWVFSSQFDDSSEQYEFRVKLGGITGYPWLFSVQINYLYTPSNESLTMQVMVAREVTCPIAQKMPLSLGFHPYFATHGSEAVIWHDDQPIAIDSSLGVAQHHLLSQYGTRLQTKNGVVTFDAHLGIEGFVFWTDDHHKYVCVEPVAGLQRPIQLSPGGFHVATVTMSFITK